MKELKKLFNNSRIGIGSAIGISFGYIMKPELEGMPLVVIAGTLMIVIVENLIAKK